MANFEERQFGEFSEALMRRLNDEATAAIGHFTISFVLGHDLCGSGTLVNAYGNRGILTAFHVAENFERHKERPLFAMISRKFHRFHLPRECFEHIPLGSPKNEKHKELGPDLSLLKLALQSPEVSTIESLKSFYRIRDNPFDVHDDLSVQDVPLEHLTWWLAGAPAERAKRGFTRGSGERALQATHMIARAEYKELVYESGFDRLTLKLSESSGLYPSSYAGCSGGGVWASGYFKADPSARDETIEVFPLLLGVAYYELQARDGYRDILANGPKSLTALKTVSKRQSPRGIPH